MFKKKTCLCVQQEDMSFCSTRRHVSFCWTITHVFLINKKTETHSNIIQKRGRHQITDDKDKDEDKRNFNPKTKAHLFNAKKTTMKTAVTPSSLLPVPVQHYGPEFASKFVRANLAHWNERRTRRAHWQRQTTPRASWAMENVPNTLFAAIHPVH